MRLLLLTALLAGVSTTAFADNWSKHWTVSQAPELHAEVADGRVDVTTGDGSTIEAIVTTKGWKIGPGEVTVSESQSGSRVQLDVHVPKMHGNYSGNREVHVEIRLPRDTSSFIHTGDGAIQIHGIRGKVQARTGDGSIEAIDIDGTLEAHTGDGHVRVTGRLDFLDIQTGDGSIEADLSSGSHMNSGWRMQTGDGHVNLRLPQDLRVNLDAHTHDGGVTVDLPIATEISTGEKNDVRGKINGGGQTLTIRTGDGSIHIEHS